MKVRLTGEAERALEGIGVTIAERNPARALSFVREIRDRCMSLASFPNRFPLVPRFESQGVRHLVHGNYLVFYRVEPDAVVILTILHGAMDYAEHLDLL
ncbi:type II toxin-antitoxin system RelE/ParE family toxin [Sphingomonas sp. RRHST34]|uniref:Type II toxin-antitoxin system RelE/ParE family toxin n=1 Tax=Sphingomonas citri TaxID=2862499 RepID=A0ABS7BLE2_9SPHN|nr:type II toxin-antitoxin system RelE/ParE family toxin [Sphingomonas citri]MBW6530424.1 type II toxin-antitoxin system RelE/ParE family toxin [Sphingomonas citri]